MLLRFHFVSYPSSNTAWQILISACRRRSFWLVFKLPVRLGLCCFQRRLGYSLTTQATRQFSSQFRVLSAWCCYLAFSSWVKTRANSYGNACTFSNIDVNFSGCCRYLPIPQPENNNTKVLSPANNHLIQTPHSCSGTVAQMYFRCAVRWFPGHCRHSATCPVYHGPANSSRNALRSEVSSHAIFRYQDSVWWLHRPAQGCLVISAFWQCWDFNLLQ